MNVPVAATVKVTDTEEGDSSFLRKDATYLKQTAWSQVKVKVNKNCTALIYFLRLNVSGFKSRQGQYFLFFCRPDHPPGSQQISCTFGVWTGRGFGFPIPTQSLAKALPLLSSMLPTWHKTRRPSPLPSHIFHCLGLDTNDCPLHLYRK